MADNRWNAQRYQQDGSFVPTLGRPVVTLLAPQPRERILDLGCGDGTLTLDLMAHCDVVGVDASSEMVAKARQRGVDAHLVDGSRLDDAVAAGVFAAGEFDAVFSNAVLHWIPAAEDVISGVHTLLKPGGRFVAEFGAQGNVAAFGVALDAAVRLHGGPTVGNPWFEPTDAEYAQLLTAEGFTVDLIETSARPTPLPTGAPAWIDTFGDPFLRQLPAERRAGARDTALDLLRPWLCDSAGSWTADYVRLRFAAHRD